MLFYLFLLIAGFVGGCLSGLLGIGGGIVYIFVIPIALKQMGVPESEIVQYTVANSLFASFFAALFANVQLWRSGHFFPGIVVKVGIPAVIISFVVLKTVVNTSWYSRDQFNTVVILLLIYMIFKALRNARTTYVESVDKKGLLPKLLTTGAAAGVVAPMSGLGGGVIIIPLLNSWAKFDIKKATSVSLGVIVLSSLSVTVLNLFESPSYVVAGLSQGYIVFEIALLLAAGVFFGAPLGVRLSQRLKPHHISYLFAGFVSLVLIQKVYEVVKW